MLASIKYSLPDRRNWATTNRFHLGWLKQLRVYRLTGQVRL